MPEAVFNDTSSYNHQSQLLRFADDTKCIHHISTLSDCNILQENVTALFTGSKDYSSDMDFNIKKFVHRYIFQMQARHYTYTMSNAYIPHTDSHKDLGVILSEEERHHNTISYCLCLQSIGAITSYTTF